MVKQRCREVDTLTQIHQWLWWFKISYSVWVEESDLWTVNWNSQPAFIDPLGVDTLVFTNYLFLKHTLTILKRGNTNLHINLHIIFITHLMCNCVIINVPILLRFSSLNLNLRETLTFQKLQTLDANGLSMGSFLLLPHRCITNGWSSEAHSDLWPPGDDSHLPTTVSPGW